MTPREVAEMIAKFRTPRLRIPPAETWVDLADDIETAILGLLRDEREACAKIAETLGEMIADAIRKRGVDSTSDIKP